MITLEGLCRNNFLLCNADKTVAKVEEIYAPRQLSFNNSITVTINGNNYTKYLDSLDFIPISISWLEMLGFRKSLMASEIYETEASNGMIIQVHISTNYVYFSARKSSSGMETDLVSRIDIKYIHEVQNLYYALTNLHLRYDVNFNAKSELPYCV